MDRDRGVLFNNFSTRTGVGLTEYHLQVEDRVFKQEVVWIPMGARAGNLAREGFWLVGKTLLGSR
jgi:hypothetical protein